MRGGRHPKSSLHPREHEPCSGFVHVVFARDARRVRGGWEPGNYRLPAADTEIGFTSISREEVEWDP